ncbi:hypothetical protein HWV62_40394 [Athelia sp. TMB]|nr:hypothetical protein HWV62_40394 [Athelia sp. TMB]
MDNRDHGFAGLASPSPSLETKISMLPMYSVIALSIIAVALLLLSAMHFATALGTVAIAVLLTRRGDGVGLVYPDYFSGLFRSPAIEYVVGKYQPRDVYGQPSSEYASNMGSDVGNTECHTTRIGYFHAGTSHGALGISGDTIDWPVKEGAQPLRVQFQRCPQLSRYGTPTDFKYWGRIIAVEPASEKKNQCLASDSGSSGLYLKLVDCESSHIPSTDQAWLYTVKSPTDEIYFVGTGDKLFGYLVEADQKVKVIANSLIIGCEDVSGTAVGFFTVK